MDRVHVPRASRTDLANPLYTPYQRTFPTKSVPTTSPPPPPTQVSELLYSPALYGVDMTSKDLPKPKGRINTALTVINNTLYLYGGIVEVGRGEKTREVTLDDMWSLDLAKLEGWKCIR